MKTIGYRDLGDARKVYNAYIKPDTHLSWLFQQKRWERIKEAFAELRYMGNIEIVYIKGKKIRTLFYKGL